MKLKPGDIVTLAHYSKSTPFQSVVLNVMENEVLLNLPRKFPAYDLFEDDPAVLGFQTGPDIFAAECSIRYINAKDGNVVLKIENTEHIKEKRIFERFPVSLYADLRIKNGKKKAAYVRNISLNGLSIVSKTNLSEGDEVVCDTYIDNRVLELAGTVIWKGKSSKNFQYGIKTVLQDYNTKNSLKLYLNILKDEQERAVLHLKEQK